MYTVNSFDYRQLARMYEYVTNIILKISTVLFPVLRIIGIDIYIVNEHRNGSKNSLR